MMPHRDAYSVILGIVILVGVIAALLAIVNPIR